MPKFKPARGKKSKPTGPPQGAVSCVVVVIAGILLVMLFMYFVLRSSGQ
jgi:hypothetical protein